MKAQSLSQASAQAQRARAWWAARPLREKAMLIGVLSLALLGGTDALITAPMEKRIKRTAGEVQAMQAKITQLTQGEEGSNAGPEVLREQEKALHARLAAAQQSAADVNRRVAEAARLPETLRAVIATVGNARLLELDLSGDTEGAAAQAAAKAQALANAPANGEARPGQSVPAAAPAPQSVQVGVRRLHKLPITLKVAGSYSELHTLLTQIERHAEALQWTSLALDNTEWPAIQLTLKAFVLSHDPRWGASS
jgi:type II secretory pathway component PulM